MRYCFSCKYLAPSDAIFCTHCGRSFGGRRCPQHHLSPPDARACGQCGSTELTESTASLVPTKLLGGVAVLAVAAVAAFVLPPLFRTGASALSSGTQRAVSQAFLVSLLDRSLAFFLVASILLRIMPGEMGRATRRGLAQGIGYFLRTFFYFLAGIPRMIAALVFAATRRR